MALRLACIFLASGHSKRFGGNKLLADYNGKPMADHIFSRFPSELFNQVVAVTRYANVAVSAAQHGFTIAENDDTTDDIAKTIRLGLAALAPGADGCMFSVCDQPALSAESIEKLVRAFSAAPERIIALGHNGNRGNPVFFPAALFPELAALEPNQSGGAVIKRHKALLDIVEAIDPLELCDVDYRADLPNK